MSTRTITEDFDITYSPPEREGGRGDYVCEVAVWRRSDNHVVGKFRGEAPRQATAERIAREKAIAAIHAGKFDADGEEW